MLSFALIGLCLGTFPSQRVSAQQSPDSQTVAELTIGLRSEDVPTRRHAAIATRSIGPNTQRQLLPVFSELLLSEKDGQVRLAVFDTVTDMGPSAAPAVPALIHTLRTDYGGKGNEERHQDYRAALALAAIGKPAVEDLRGLLEIEAVNVRAEVALALGRIGLPAASAVSDLIELLDDEEPRVRQEASVALGRIGRPSVAELLTAADSENAVVRAAAVQSLGMISPSVDRVRQRIVHSAQDEEPAVRVAAMDALPQFELSSDARCRLVLQNLQHDNESVRLAVVNSVVHDHDLLRLIQPELSNLLTGEHDGVAWHAAFLLQQLGSSAAPTLIAALRQQDTRIEQIGRALALIGRPVADLLAESLHDPAPRVRQGAALALGQIRPPAPQTVARLVAGLSDPDRDVQAAFLTSIGQLGSRARDAVPAVREKLQDESSTIREQAIGILFQAAPHDADLIDDLIGVLDDEEPAVQRRAIDAIRSTGPLGRRALRRVVDKLSSPHDDVRIAAAAMIGSHGRAAAEAVPALTMLLDSSDTRLRIAVTETLSEVGSAALPAFEKLTTMLNDEDVQVRAAVVRTIGNLDLEPEQARPHLAQALHDEESDVRRQAFRAIQRFGRRGTVFLPDLIALAADDEQSGYLTRVLERFEAYAIPSATIAELTQLLAHDNPAVRLPAIQFLTVAGPAATAALPELMALQEDSNEDIRAAADKAIAAINGNPAELTP